MSPVLAALCALAFVQDENEQLKKSILDKVRDRLREERVRILKRVAEIIDEELRKDGKTEPKTESETEKRIRELERKLRILEDQREDLVTEIGKTKRLAADEELRRDAPKLAPRDEAGAKEAFDKGVKELEAKRYDDAIRTFKILHYGHPKTSLGVLSAYNIACGYALAGKKDHALDWLEIAVEGGYQRFDHLRKDPDLDSLRGERRYKKLLADK